MDFFSADWLNLVQWPAMAASIVSAWLVGSNNKLRRNIGFWCFLFSNVLWVVWGLHTDARALIALQIALAALNIRGLKKTDTHGNEGKDGKPSQHADAARPQAASHSASGRHA